MSQGAENLAKAFEITEAFPDHLLEGMRKAQAVGAVPGTFRSALSVGMGGSAIAGDLLASLSNQAGRIPVAPVRSLLLPSWAGQDTLAIFTSYSGNTEETLDAFRSAAARGIPRAVVTSGGQLLEAALADGAPVVQVPPGFPQRTALGLLFGALYGLLLPHFPGGEEAMLRTTESLRSLRPSLTSQNGFPYRVAEAWQGRELWVYVPERLAPVGRRWAGQASENAKRLAHFDTLPEAMHNAIVGWDQITPEDASRKKVVILTGPTESKLVQERIRFLAEMVRRRGTAPLLVPLTLDYPLGQVLEGTWVGDFSSLFEARMTGVDPLPVAAIDRMKAGQPP